MFGWLFGTRDLVVRLGRGEDRRAFVAALGDAELWLLSLRLDAALDAPLTREQLLALKEANAKDLSERTEFSPFTYPRDGRRCLPVFSSLDFAQEFLGLLSDEVDRVVPFQAVSMKGRALREVLLSAEQVAINARTRHERMLGGEDLRLIAENWAEPGPADRRPTSEGTL
jgi:hypothetical protein